MDGLPLLAIRASSQQQAQLRQPWCEVVAEHRLLIARLVRSFVRRAPAVSRDDLLQEAHIALWQASRKFDVTQGRPFSHYASVCIKNALQECLNRERTRLEVASESLDLDVADRDGAEPESGVSSSSGSYLGRSGSGMAYQHCLMNELSMYVRQLSPQLQAVYFKHVLAGCSQPEVARTLRVTQQRVAKLKTQLFGRLMEFLIEPQ